MDVTPLITRDKKIIQSYRNGEFKISNVVYNHPVFILPDKVLAWTQADILDIKSFAALKDEDIEVLLLGTGERQVMIPPAMRQTIKDSYGFTIESMDTGAASRTYNVLMAEGRKVAAALK